MKQKNTKPKDADSNVIKVPLRVMRIYLYDTKGKPVSILYEYFDSPLVPIKGDIITIRETSFIVVKRELCCSDLQLNIVRVYVSLIEK